MKKALLSTLIFLGLFCAAINAEALTDTERLQMLQRHAGDIAFVDDTTLEDVAWLTKSLSKGDLKWIAEYLKKQTNPSGVDVLEALVGAQDPDRDARFYAPLVRRIKNIPYTPRKLAELNYDTIDAFFETSTGERYLKFCDHSKYGYIAGYATIAPAVVWCITVLYYTNSSYVRNRNKLGINNDEYAVIQKIDRGIRTGIITSAALVLTAIVAKNVLGRG